MYRQDGKQTLVSPLRVALFLMGIAGLLLVAHIVAHGVEEVIGDKLPERATAIWYLEEENNIPTWVSGMMLAMIGGVLLIIGVLKYHERDRDYRQWLALAFLPLLVSLDDMAQLHEALDNPLHDTADFSGLLYGAWIVVVAPLVLLVAIPFIPFLRRLPRRTAMLLLLGAGTTFGAGVILEMPEGLWVDSHGESGLVWFTIFTTQEILEMVGAIIALYAVIDYLAGYRPDLTFRVERDRLPFISEDARPLADEGGLVWQQADWS